MKVFITGGTTGIGFELAKSYLYEGHVVAICGRDLMKLPQGFQEQFPNLYTYQLSVTDAEALRKVIREFSDRTEEPGLDIMVANAGRSHGSKSRLPDFDISRDIIEVNVVGVLNAFGPAVEVMLEQKKGLLVAIASVAGFVGLPGASAYSASKAAVVTLCESYHLDLKSQNIDVTCICPGFIDTPLTRQNNHAMPWLMPVEKAVIKIRKAIEKRKAFYLFPWQMKWVILLLSRMPRRWYRFIMQMPFANYSHASKLKK